MEVDADDDYEYVTETVVLHIPTADTSKPGTDSKNAHGTSNTQSHSLMDQTSVSIRQKHDADGNFIEEEEVLVRYGSRVYRVEERKPIGTHLLFQLPPQSESNSEQESKASFVTNDLKHYYVTKEFVHKAANVASGE